jgi:hypothetical protein
MMRIKRGMTQEECKDTRSFRTTGQETQEWRDAAAAFSLLQDDIPTFGKWLLIDLCQPDCCDALIKWRRFQFFTHPQGSS